MKRWILILLSVLGVGAAYGEKRTFYIKWSAAKPMETANWSGHAEVEPGTVVRVQKDSGASDKVNVDLSWMIVYGRSLKARPTVKPREKGLWLTVDCTADATITVVTKSGTFSFMASEVKKKGLERLDGNVRILPGNAVRRRARRRRGGRRRPSLPPAKILGEFPAERITVKENQSDWPALAIARNGTPWVAYVQWDGQKSDRVLVRRKDQSGWSEPIVLDDGGWDHYWPSIAPLGRGVAVVWSGQEDGNFDLYCAKISAAGKVESLERITTAPWADFNARMAATRDGSVVLAWQSFRNGRSDVYGRWLRRGKWGPEVRISPSDANDWEPDVACDSTGAAWIVWDSYHAGNYDVFLRRFANGEMGDVISITSETKAQFHSTVAVDRSDRAWVAWDEAGKNWGKDCSRSSSAPGSSGLHASRNLAIRVCANGSLLAPKVKWENIITGAMTKYAELPRLAVDGTGTLWLVFRHWTIRKPTEMFHFYAARLAEGGWEGPWRLANSSGRNSQHPAVALARDGRLVVAYSSDGRSPKNLPKDQVHALPYNVWVASLPKGKGTARVAMDPLPAQKVRQNFPVPLRPVLTVGGKNYTLVYGDCHRHTDIRGHSGVDGSILDTFRYALDAVPLDYMGFGDHNEVFGGRWPDGLRDYQWWWTQKAIDMFTHPPVFIGLYSYEHSMASPAGHRNILFLRRGAPLRMIDRAGKGTGKKGLEIPDNQPPNLWKWVEKDVLTQRGQECVIVPHTFAAGPLAYWNWPTPPFDRLLEIYQGCRGSYEAYNLPPGEKRGPTQTKKPGHFAQDALARGNKYGFVSFSDHRSTHNSFGAVWVSEISREAIFDAMLARHTFAASDQIILKVTADNHMAGDEFTATAKASPAFLIDVHACDRILRVDVVKDGKYVWTRRPEGKTFSAQYRDERPEAGECYYYVRVFQRDPEAPDGDPEIAWGSPFFVTYE